MANTVYVGARTLRGLSAVIVLIGLAAVIASCVLFVRSITGSPDTLRLGVELTEGATIEQAYAYLREHNPQQAGFTANTEGLTLVAPDPTRAEIVVGSAGDVLLGLTVGACAFLLYPVLTSIAAGRPFGARNARRLGILGAVTGLSAFLVPLIPKQASISALDRLGLAGPDSPFLFGAGFPLTAAILFPLVFLVLAEAFRQGEKLHHDVEGLV